MAWISIDLIVPKELYNPEAVRRTTLNNCLKKVEEEKSCRMLYLNSEHQQIVLLSPAAYTKITKIQKSVERKA